MTPHKQLVKHDPDNQVYGDCHRTAIACLLDLNPFDVPHFNHDSPGGKEFNLRVERWLASKGLCTVSVAFNCSLEEMFSWMKACNPGVYFLLGGRSRSDCNHTVIGCDDAIAWDPSPREAGIVGPCTEDGMYWVTFLLPLSMRKAEA